MFISKGYFKAIKAVLIVLIVSMMFVGCSKNKSMTPGDYTVEVVGMQKMVVKVSLSESEILAIEVLEHDETKGIAEPALEEFPKTLIDFFS